MLRWLYSIKKDTVDVSLLIQLFCMIYVVAKIEDLE